MGLSDDCKKLFKTINLYEILAVEKNATEAQLKKAYKKASLLCHPDKVAESRKKEATKKFQVLSKVHFILSDAGKRAIYDETGHIEEDDSILATNASGDVWSSYFRTVFPRVTPQAIDNYLMKYTGSKEETDDLVTNYVKYEGDMDKISESFIGYQLEEEERFCQVLNDLIQRKRIPAFPKFVNETQAKKAARHRRQKRYKKEAPKAEKMQESLLNAMALRVEQRKSQYNDLICNLVMKYGPTKTNKRDRKQAELEKSIEFVDDDVSYSDFKKALSNTNTSCMCDDSLISLFANRAKERERQFNELIDKLEEKYGKKKESRKKKKA